MRKIFWFIVALISAIILFYKIGIVVLLCIGTLIYSLTILLNKSTSDLIKTNTDILTKIVEKLKDLN